MGNAEVPSAVREQRLEQWFTQYGTEILRTCYVILSNAAQAEDAMQDTFLKAWHCMGQFEGRNGSNEKTWLIRIAINICRDYRRSKWFRHVDMSKAIEEIPLHMNTALPEDRILLMDILRLPEKYKKVILLYYYQDMTLQEVAQVLGTTYSSVQRRLRKAQELLKQTLTGRNIDDEKSSQTSY